MIAIVVDKFWEFVKIWVKSKHSDKNLRMEGYAEKRAGSIPRGPCVRLRALLRENEVVNWIWNIQRKKGV